MSLGMGSEMKKIFTLALTSVSASAFAISSNSVSVSGNSACAPEVAEGNLKATERVLKDVASRTEFDQATKFKATIAKIAALESNQKKFEAYMGLVAVNPTKIDDVANFVGARDLNSYAAAIEKNLDLNKAESQVVADELVKALRGNQ
jgi:hypothetical protein